MPSSAITLNATSCNPNDTGTIVRTLTAANGCDSIVTTITTLAPFSSVTINTTTCNAANAGTTIDTLVGSNGCDSIVTTITTLLPSSATTLNTTSCNPNDTGTVVRTLTAANGCDSIVTTITSLINCFTVDTIRDTNQIGTSIVVCVPLEPNFEVTTGSIGNCGYTNQSGNIYTVDNNGCITIVRSNLVGYNLDTICVVVCNSVGLCVIQQMLYYLTFQEQIPLEIQT
ncbi:MAG: hypothetical protein IPL21_12730 [Saprospirales bacterium]|nr:hypothetical protein [Saprospirales bacterium]